MPRKMRVEYSGAMYHVMSRGDQRDAIFLDDVDRHESIKTLAEACQKTDWWVHAFCLMKNHYHMVIETPNGNLVAGMQWLQSTYTIRLNNRHTLAGHVLSGRYKAQLVEGSGSGYLRTACDYVHLNPGSTRLETATAKAERLIANELMRLSWTSEHLIRRPKSDPLKLALAARLRRETTLSIKQIAGRLNLGKPKGAKSNLHKWMKGPPDDASQPKLDIERAIAPLLFYGLTPQHCSTCGAVSAELALVAISGYKLALNLMFMYALSPH
jgi:REP element-mobilizing transposase RayT